MLNKAKIAHKCLFRIAKGGKGPGTYPPENYSGQFIEYLKVCNVTTIQFSCYVNMKFAIFVSSNFPIHPHFLVCPKMLAWGTCMLLHSRCLSYFCYDAECYDVMTVMILWFQYYFYISNFGFVSFIFYREIHGFLNLPLKEGKDPRGINLFTTNDFLISLLFVHKNYWVCAKILPGFGNAGGSNVMCGMMSRHLHRHRN